MKASKVLAGVFGFLFVVAGVRATTIAYWRFEPGNLTVDSVGGYTLANTAVTSSVDVPGYGSTGSALFNGSAIMSTLSTLNLTPYTQLTIEWFMKPNLPMSTTTAPAFEDGSNLWDVNGTGAVAAWFNNQSPGINMFEVDTRLALPSKVYTVTPGGVVGGAWHHYAMEVDTANIANFKLFIDGVPTGTLFNGGTGSYTFRNDTFNIGARSSNMAYAFTGNIDEFRISSGLLAPNQFLNAVPEPSTVTLFGLGALLAFRRHRRLQ